MINIGNDWDGLLKGEFEKPYFKQLREFLAKEYREHEIYPPAQDIFNALRYSSYENTKVIILGQDPYHEPGQAQGLCFSVGKGVQIPPSLINIYKEIENDLGIAPQDHGSLISWARQGVLLLNTVLTVRRGQANSHRGKGWEIFTDNAIRALGADERPKVFLLWGSYARSKKALISCPVHLILESAHPSPLSAYRGFFGNGHFKACNDFLASTGQKPIVW